MVAFYSSTKMVYKAEGWPGEPILRYDEMRRMFQFIERETGKDLGSSYMQQQRIPEKILEYEKQGGTVWSGLKD